MAEIFTEVEKAGKTIATSALRVAYGNIFIAIASDNVQVTTESGDFASKLGKTAITLGALYTGYSLIRPLVQSAVEKAFGSGLNDEDIREPKTESLADYESETAHQRLEEEFAKVGLRVKGLKVKIEGSLISIKT